MKRLQIPAHLLPILSLCAKCDGLIVSRDESIAPALIELAKLKLLRPRFILDGNAQCGDLSAIRPAYEMTAKGRAAARGGAR